MLLAAVIVLAAVLAAPKPAAADTGGYPNADATTVNASSYEWGYTDCANACSDPHWRDTLNGVTYYLLSPRGYAYRNCTDYVAWKLQDANGFSSTGGWGNGYEWGTRAQTAGYAVNMTPAKGAVAWWNANVFGMSSFGHVAYVESVSADGNTVNLSEYNNPADGNYHTRSIAKDQVSGYIHFKDVGDGGQSFPSVGHDEGGPSTTPSVLAVATNPDGRLEIFYIGGDNAVWHRWQLSPGGSWSGEERLGGIARSIAAGVNANGRLEIFYVGLDNAVWHRWRDTVGSSWSGEYSFGGWAKAVAVGRNADGRLEIVTIGLNGGIWHRWQTSPNGSWSGETEIGGGAKAVAVGRNADGRLEIFTVGVNNSIWHRTQAAPNGAWSGEAEIGGGASAVTAGRNADGRQEIFTVGNDNAVWHRTQASPNGGWSGEARIGGIAKDVVAGMNQDGRMEVFTIGVDNNVWHRWQTAPNGGLSAESRLGGWVKI